MVAGGFQPVNQNTVFICVASQSPQSETEQHHRLPPDHTRVRKAWGKVAGGISSPNQVWGNFDDISIFIGKDGG